MADEKLIIGVLGGMGPYATVALYKRLVDAFPTEKDWQKPRILIDSYSTIPSRVRALLYGEKTEELMDCMTDSLRWLVAAGVNKIIVACNTAHAFLPEVIKRFPESERYILNIIEACAEECQTKGYRKVRLLASEGTVQAGIYERVFSNYQIAVDVPDIAELQNIRKLIEDVKQNRINKESLDLFKNLINKNMGEPVVLGCTELPVLYEECKERRIELLAGIVDPLQSVIDKLTAV